MGRIQPRNEPVLARVSYVWHPWLIGFRLGLEKEK